MKEQEQRSRGALVRHERRRAHDEHPVEQFVAEAVVRHPRKVVDRPLLLVVRKEPIEGLILDRHNTHRASPGRSRQPAAMSAGQISTRYGHSTVIRSSSRAAATSMYFWPSRTSATNSGTCGSKIQ